jgi:hypothetical protein
VISNEANLVLLNVSLSPETLLFVSKFKVTAKLGTDFWFAFRKIPYTPSYRVRQQNLLI